MAEQFAAGPPHPGSSPNLSPKLSVVSITYNHEAFIRDALDGFVAQKTDFPVEVIVADDASTDATPAIIAEYADRYPDLFRPILRSQNIGVHANFKAVMSAARGEYLAVCEGDDYWTDPLKLTKQVEYMDRHPQTTVCFHPVRVTQDDGSADSEFPPLAWRRDLSVEALLARNFIQTNSVVYRRHSGYDDVPADIMPIDWYLHVRHAVRGEIAMLPETMAVYRRHSQGIWYAVDKDSRKFWLARGPGFMAMLDAMLGLIPHDHARQRILGEVAEWAFREISEVPGPQARTLLLDSIARYPRIALLSLQRHWQTPRQRFARRCAAGVSRLRDRAADYAARAENRRATRRRGRR